MRYKPGISGIFSTMMVMGYDAFYSDVSKQLSIVEKKDANYNIDSDGNGEWDYTLMRHIDLFLTRSQIHRVLK